MKEQIGYAGGLANPMSWDRTVEKFHWLSEAFADEDLRTRLIETVQQLDTAVLSDLTDLLAQVRPAAVFRLLTLAFSNRVEPALASGIATQYTRSLGGIGETSFDSGCKWTGR